MFSLVTDPLLNILYPKSCGSCGEPVERLADGAACGRCWNATKIFGPLDALCPHCGAWLQNAFGGPGSPCRQCDDHDYDSAHACGLYEKALAASVIQLKHTPHVPARISELLTGLVDRTDPAGSLTVIPVPLSKQRLVERGFNQASLLAKVIAKHSRIRLDEHSLVRSRDMPMHRAAMDRKAREATVRNVFAVVRPGLIQGRTVLLVDDVMTSGSTVSYCARVLKRNGAEKVIVLTLARAVLNPA